jgi:flavin-binding protein dodecin
VPDRPDDRELASALERELRTLADQGPRELRMRLLVTAHAAGLLAAPERDGDRDDPDLAAAIRAGRHDHELAAVAARLARAPRTRESARTTTHQEAERMSNHVYKSIEVTGSSETGTDDAIRRAIEKASATVHNLDWFEVTSIRGHLADGAVDHWQVTLKIGFRLD